MVIFSTISHPLFFLPSSHSLKLQANCRSLLSSHKRPSFGNPRSSRLVVFATGGRSNGNGDATGKVEAGGGPSEMRRARQTAFNFRWRDLLNPDPENILAVGLTGLLTWASVQVLFQLFFISIAIVLAALKYSFIAALLLFILIALL
ncbi:hypothetical protein KSP40_PGU014327 [Platanthera guangdongensis]|uniref:Uncharacterized protein n=1 Tax=Platanthera guangdongensis TaxID=2320717 RepID=A0ABR2LNC9_9ASPA